MTMLPDFPNTKDLILKRVSKQITRLEMEKHPILSEMKSFAQHEGRLLKFQQIGFGEKTQEAEEQQVAIPITWEEVPDLHGEKLTQKLGKMAEDMGALKMKMFFKRVDESVEQTGNKLDAQGKAPDGAMLLDMIEMAEEDFDSSGNSQMKWLLHPDMIPAMKKASKEIEDDPELTRRRDAINSRHREQWLGRENNRKLVD
jgi:hypothetical protein